MCNSIHALTCYSSNQGAGDLGGQTFGTTDTPFCYVNPLNQNDFLFYNLFVF